MSGTATLAPWEQLSELEQRICEAVPPVQPPPVHWLEADASEIFCYEHARDARWIEMGNVGPTYPDTDRWSQRRDDVQENMHEGIGAYMERCPGESDHSEACATCGCTLEYLLTDYGLDEELAHFDEHPVVPGDDINGEVTYALTRLFINMTQPWVQEHCPDKVLACLKIAEDTWTAIEHARAAA